MSRGRGVARKVLHADSIRLLGAFDRALDEQPAELTRRFGVLNLFWVAVEALGARRGPEALDELVAAGYLRRHPRHPEVGRITPAGLRLIESAPAAAA